MHDVEQTLHIGKNVLFILVHVAVSSSCALSNQRVDPTTVEYQWRIRQRVVWGLSC